MLLPNTNKKILGWWDTIAITLVKEKKLKLVQSGLNTKVYSIDGLIEA